MRLLIIIFILCSASFADEGMERLKQAMADKEKPLSYSGIVFDENDNYVPGATVKVIYYSFDPNNPDLYYYKLNEEEVLSDASGEFSFGPVNGFKISVDGAIKEGFEKLTVKEASVSVASSKPSFSSTSTDKNQVATNFAEIEKFFSLRLSSFPAVRYWDIKKNSLKTKEGALYDWKIDVTSEDNVLLVTFTSKSKFSKCKFENSPITTEKSNIVQIPDGKFLLKGQVISSDNVTHKLDLRVLKDQDYLSVKGSVY
jgi:hypothetical protein